MEICTFNYNKTASKNDMDLDLPPFLMPQQEDGTKIIEAEYHTLFVSEEDPVLKEFTATDDGQEFSAVREIVPKHKKYTLFIESFAHRKANLHKVLFELRKATEHDILEIRISSNGGYVSEGLTLFNTMREIFNGRTVTYLDSRGYSMGAMLFSLGDERVAYEDSSLMYHNFSSGAFGKGEELQSYIEYEVKHFDRFFKGKIVNYGFLTEDEYKRMRDGKDYWFDAYDLAKRGISTHVIVSGFKLDNEAFIEYYEQEKPIEEWVFDKISEMQKEDGDDPELEEIKEEIKKAEKKKPAPKKKKQAPKKTAKKKAEEE